MELKGKVVVYTGAAGYLGRAAAMAMAKRGAKLALVDVNEAALNDFRTLLAREVPGAALATYCDANWLEPATIDAMLTDVVAKFGRIDALVLSAYPRTSDWHLKFENVPAASLQKNLHDHLGGYMIMAQRAALKMIPQKGGTIIMFGSIYGLVGPDFSVYEGLDAMTMPVAYSAIKGALTNYTRYLASYLGPHGIRVNCLCPGGVKDAQDPRFIAKYESKVPMRRMATVDDVVGPLLFLLSDYSAYVSGVSLAVDGGWTAI